MIKKILLILSLIDARALRRPPEAASRYAGMASEALAKVVKNLPG